MKTVTTCKNDLNSIRQPQHDTARQSVCPMRFAVMLRCAMAWVLFASSAILGHAQAQAPQADADVALPNLPHDVSSFGAAVAGDWLYVYGGHTGEAHQYSVEDISGSFHRLNLRQSKRWEALPGGPLLQGLAVVAHEGSVYRIGGLTALNEVVDEEHIRSTDGVARFDASRGKWQTLTPLPQPRSSHDAVVYDGKVYVLGGWNLEQKGEEGNDNPWRNTGLVADLDADPIVWHEIAKPPFQRRALAVAAANDRVYVIGGMKSEGGTSNRVDIYDIKTDSWSRGPDYPAQGRMKAFGVSAFGVGSRIYATAMNGKLCYLEHGDDNWTVTGTELDQPRFFHRLVADGDRRLLIVGGASRGGMKSGIEMIPLGSTAADSAAKTNEQADEVFSADHPSPASRWQGFRGTGNSHSNAANLPVVWSATSHIRWSVDLPGYGQSSPVVWEDRAFVTSVSGPLKDQLHVTCLTLADGKVLWQRQFEGTQKVEDSDYVSKAACTPAIDSEGIYLLFESGDLIALDHQGQDLWQRSLIDEYGAFEGNHGIGTSLAQTDEAVVVLIDHGAPGYLLSIDKRTGKNNWKVDRPKRVSWSSPVISTQAGSPQILISSNGVVEAWDAQSGVLIWNVIGLNKNTVATPSITDDLVIVGASEKQSCMAIRRGGRGDVTETHVAWRSQSTPGSFCSPLILEDTVIFINKAGVADCLDLETGESLWSERLGNPHWASPVKADGRVYFFGQKGLTIVAKPNRNGLNIQSRNELPTENRVYGVAVVNESILIREGSKLTQVRNN